MIVRWWVEGQKNSYEIVILPEEGQIAKQKNV